MINSTQYRKHAIKSKYPYWLIFKRYWKPMVGTCESTLNPSYPRSDANKIALSWFMYDFVTYPFGLFSSTIIEQLGPSNTTVENIGYGVSHPPFHFNYTANLTTNRQ